MEYQEKIHPTVGVLVRSNGEVFVPPTANRKKGRWTFGSANGLGYLRVQVNGKRYCVHRLVLEAFVGPCPKGFECDHSDRDRRNNALTNLRWVSPTQNCRNTSKTDRVDARGGTHSYEDYRQFCKERDAHHCKTHKRVYFSDGKRRWIPNSEALLLLAIPANQRIFKG